MGTVQHWTGREAKALRQAMRKSLRSFADYLGVSDRTVSKWEAGGGQIVPMQDSQALLDTAYVQADADVRARFHAALGTPGPPQNPLSDSFAFVPAPEPGLVNRTDELESIVSVLTDAVSADGIATVAVCGPGGFGKTTLATQIGHDHRIRGVFAEILWVETGEDCTPARVVELISDLCVHLGGTRPAFTEPEQAGFHLAHLLRGRRALLVIDNVWSAADLVPFLLGGEECVRLVTTRNVRVCPGGTRIVRVGSMTAAEVSELLTRNVASLAQDQAVQLSQVCGGWPLLASVIGASVSQDIAAGAPAQRVASETNEALREYGPQAFDVWDADQRRNAIGHAITASLLSLDESIGISGASDLRERYLSLAVFPPTVPIPLPVLARWWGTSYGWNPIAVRQFCRVLADRSLVSAYLADRDAITLHDVFRSYLRRTIKDQWADLHRTLLDAYRPTSGEPWAELSSEHAYMWRHLPYHLHEAGLDEELVHLLADPSFVVTKVQRAGHQSLSADATVLDAVRSAPGSAPALGSNLALATTLCRAGYLLHDLTARSDIAATLDVALRRAHPEVETTASAADSPLEVRWAQQASHTAPVGHVGAVTSVAAAASLVCSGGEDGTVRLWNMASRRLLRSHRGHTGWVFATALSPDAGLLASAGDDGAIRLWDTRTGMPTAVLPGHQRRIRSVAFTPDGALLVSGAEDGRINVWDTAQGTLLRGMKTVGTPVWSVAVDSEGCYVAASGEDEFVRLYDLSADKLLDEKAGHRDWVRSVAFARSAPLLASASGDRSVAVWSVTGGKLTALRDHTDLPARVRAVVFAGPDEDAVIAATETPELRLLTAEPSSVSTRLPPDVDWVRSLAGTSDGMIVAGCEDGALRLWSPTSRSRTPVILAPGSNTTWSVQFTSDGSSILAGDGNGAVDLLSPETGAPSRTLTAGVGRVWSLAAGGQWAAAAGGDGTVRLWSLNTDLPPRELNSGAHRTWCVGMPSSGTLIAATTGDGLVRCWDTPTGDLLWQQNARAGRLRSLAFDHSGDMLAASGGDGTVCLWRGITGEHVSRFVNPGGWARAVALDVPGQRLAIGGGNGEIHIRSVSDDRFTAHLLGHTGRVLMAAFLDDPDHLASAAADGTVRLWSLTEQRQLAEVRVDASLHCAAYDQTAGHVVVGSAAGTVAFSIRPH
ncbi:NB-ARC domain-containing protein [Streptomyces sp. NPDC088141]|uniref:NB-ARC domain-containing protein n=1 Tax=Streptomyces sp. NPDC088141 TaxID=3155179 RepID=UPI00343C9836